MTELTSGDDSFWCFDRMIGLYQQRIQWLSENSRKVTRWVHAGPSHHPLCRAEPSQVPIIDFDGSVFSYRRDACPAQTEHHAPPLSPRWFYSQGGGSQVWGDAHQLEWRAGPGQTNPMPGAEIPHLGPVHARSWKTTHHPRPRASCPKPALPFSGPRSHQPS